MINHLVAQVIDCSVRVRVCVFFSGHIGIAVPDLDAACEFFEEQGATFIKKPNSGEKGSSVS